jgi:hypothetical protein
MDTRPHAAEPMCRSGILLLTPVPPLLKLSDAQRPLADPVEIQAAAHRVPGARPESDRPCRRD